MAKTEGGWSSHFLLLAILCIVPTDLAAAKDGHGQVTIFIFGDSTVDVGTNNLLNGTSALANFPYNGIDFPHSIPTGRFSNGFNLADQLAWPFGYEKSPQPYLYLVKNMSSFREEILRGVNFASGGSGILEKTGSKSWGRVVSLREQIEQFASVPGNISEMKDGKEAAKIVSNSLYIFSVGSNDILDPIRLGTNLTKELLADICSAYRQHLENLYNMGARKFGIVAAAPIGCCPSLRAMNKSRGGSGGCLREANDFARAFYRAMDTLLQNMTSKFPDMKYSLANTYKMTQYVLRNYPSLGFNETNKACCGSGDYNGAGPCIKTQNPNLCDDRSKYLFWDLYHPSQAATALSAMTLYRGDLYFIKPMNFSLLAHLQL